MTHSCISSRNHMQMCVCVLERKERARERVGVCVRVSVRECAHALVRVCVCVCVCVRVRVQIYYIYICVCYQSQEISRREAVCVRNMCVCVSVLCARVHARVCANILHTYLCVLSICRDRLLETYNCIDPTHRSHPICVLAADLGSITYVISHS